jgi:hypothetical protein
MRIRDFMYGEIVRKIPTFIQKTIGCIAAANENAGAISGTHEQS